MNRECKFSSHNSNDRPQSNNLLTVKPNWRTNLTTNNPTIQSTTLPSKHQISCWIIASKQALPNQCPLFGIFESVLITFRTSHICPQRSQFPSWLAPIGFSPSSFPFLGRARCAWAKSTRLGWFLSWLRESRGVAWWRPVSCSSSSQPGIDLKQIIEAIFDIICSFIAKRLGCPKV